jgi:hypothetical protein
MTVTNNNKITNIASLLEFFEKNKSKAKPISRRVTRSIKRTTSKKPKNVTKLTSTRQKPPVAKKRTCKTFSKNPNLCMTQTDDNNKNLCSYNNDTKECSDINIQLTVPIIPPRPRQKTRKSQPIIPLRPRQKTRKSQPIIPLRPGQKTRKSQPIIPLRPGQKTRKSQPIIPLRPGQKKSKNNSTHPSGEINTSSSPEEIYHTLESLEDNNVSKKSINDPYARTNSNNNIINNSIPLWANQSINSKVNSKVTNNTSSNTSNITSNSRGFNNNASNNKIYPDYDSEKKCVYKEE